MTGTERVGFRVVGCLVGGAVMLELTEGMSMAIRDSADDWYIIAHFFNPYMQVTGLKAPHRTNYSDMYCQWEFRLKTNA
jgi:hypothetical protein